MSFPVPWGAYIAGHSNNTSTSLYDFTGNGRNATMSGVTLTSGSGNGASASIPFLTGTSSTTITWPAGSIPATFTICSITRYTSAPYSRIFDGAGSNWLHGHWAPLNTNYTNSGYAGVAFYGKWVTQNSSTNLSPTTNWAVVCGTNDSSIPTPNNLLVNGTGYGTVNGGTGSATLTINNGVGAAGNEKSNFAFQTVLLWNTGLTSTQMNTISTLLNNYLSTGSITYPWSGGPTYSLNQNYIFGKFDTSYNVLNQVVTTGTVYSPNCVSSNGKNMISFVGTYPNYQTYYSNNYGATWALSNMPTTILGDSCSPVNYPNVFYVGANNGAYKLYRSADGGATWTLISTAFSNVHGLCSNDVDTILYVSSYGSAVYYSTKSGNTSFNYANNTGTFTFTLITGSNNNFKYGPCFCSPDGTFLYGSAVESNRAFKYNFNNTSSFDATLTSAYNTIVCTVAMSSNGKYLYAALYLNASYALIRSTDGGTSFSDITGIITKNSACSVSCDLTGQYVQVTHNTSWWVSSNYGTTFTVYSGGAIPSAPTIFNNNQFVSLISNTSTQYGPLSNPSYPYLKTPPKYVVGGATTQASLGNTFIAYSNDGQTWTQSSNASVIFGYYIRRIANSGSMFVATSGGINNSSYTIGYSYDGNTWYPSANGNSILSTTAMGLDYANGMWVAGGTGNFSLAYSYDGINWTGSGSSTLFGTGAKAAYVTYKNSTWVAAAYDGTTQAKIAYSSNGINWTLITDTKLDLFVTGIDWNGTKWVAVGKNSANTVQIIYSPSLTGTWTSAPGTSQIFGSGTFGYSVVWNGSYFLATGGGSTVLARSTDGITWTSSTPAGFSSYNTLIWTGTFWFVFGEYVSGYGTIQTSTDGITWTPTTINPAGTLVASSVSYALNQSVTLNASTTPTYNINNANLLYYYPFDNDYLDYKDSTNPYGVSNAVSISLVSISKSTTKLNNGSLLLPGVSNETFQVPNTTFTNNGVAFSIWMKLNTAPAFSHTIIDFGSGANINNIILWLANGSLVLSIINPSIGTQNNYTGVINVTDFIWHHYCVNITSTGACNVYVDGVSVINTTLYPAVNVSLTSCLLGRGNAPSNVTTYGSINANFNQFVVFNRTLSATERSYLFNYPTQIQFSSSPTGLVSNPSYNINNSNLLIYYPFDGDSSNYATGTGVSDATTPLSISTTTTKLSSGAMYFPGTDQTTKVKAVNTTFTTNGITFSLWFKNVGTIPSGNNSLFDFGLGANNNGNIMFFFTGSPNGSVAVVAYSPLSSTTGTITNTPLGFTLSDNNWHHYVLTISSGGIWTAWVDGVQYSSPSWTVVPSTSARTFCQIGTNNFGNTPVNGYMNQFCVFNRVLTASEIRLLTYYPSQIVFSGSLSSTFSIPATSTYNINSSNLLYYYPFDSNYADYASGVGVINATTTNVTISTANTKLTSGSVLFPGSTGINQKVQIPSTTLTTNGVTIAFWAKITLQSGVSPQFIFNFASGGAVNTVGMWLTGTGGFQLMLYNASSVGNSYGLNYTLADANWHHYCVTASSTAGVWSFYVDGVSIAISITSYPTTAAMTTSYIGANNLGNANINGNMNQFLVFNRVITATELSYLVNYPSQVGFSSAPTAAISSTVISTTIYPCFKEGSKILTLDPETDIESYVHVESLRPGDLIRTSQNGHKAVFHIGKRTLLNPSNDPDPRNRLYRLPKSISKGMTADLYITGEHCILHKSISDEFKERVRKHMGDVYITEHQYRVPACIDDRAEPYKDNDPVTIWHFALENHSIYRNYGVYANGLLVESCSIQYLTEMSNMELVD